MWLPTRMYGAGKVNLNGIFTFNFFVRGAEGFPYHVLFYVLITEEVGVVVGTSWNCETGSGADGCSTHN